MANPSLQIGNGKWAIKEDNLLGYSKAGTRFVPEPITMTRESAGTRVNSSGLVETVELLGSELVDCGDFSCAVPLDYWSNTGTNTSVLDGNLVFNGNSANTWAIQSLFSAGLYNGKILKITYTISENTLVGSGNFRRGGYSGSSVFPSSSNLNTTVGTHTEYITVNSSGNNNALDLWITSGYTSGNLKISNISLKESTKNNLARVDYDGTASSLLVEPERTNLLTYSEDFTSWTEITNITLTANSTTSPSGDSDGTKFLSTSTGNYVKEYFSAVSGTTYTLSVYCKNIDATSIRLLCYDGANSFSNYHQDEVNTSTWTRISLTFTAANTGSGNFQIARNLPNGESAYFWGAQLEVGSYPTSYIPTDGGTVTRVKDTVVKSGFQSDGIFGSTEGSAVFDFKWDLTNYIFDFEEPSGVKIRIFNENNSTWKLRDINGAAWYNTGFTISEGERSIIAFKWSGTEVVAFQNGDKSSAVATFASSMAINSIGSGNNLNNLSSMKFYKTALTDDELKTLTTI